MPTTLETFEQLIRHQSAKELLPFLLALNKEELVPVRQRVLSLEKELRETQEPTGEPEKTRSSLTMPRAYLLFLAGLATFSAREARRLSPWYSQQLMLPEGWPAQGEAPPFLVLIRRFRPAWLGEWLVRRTRDNRWAVPQYVLLRELLADGLLQYDPWLLAQSLSHLPTHYNWRRNDVPGGNIPDYDQLILKELRANTTLLGRDLPLLLDYDTMADTASTWSGAARTSVTWQTLLAALLASGDLDRGEWLTHCLLALRRDFRRPLLTWVKNLYASLQPTPDELLHRQEELRELLSHPLPLVVNFALDQLKSIWDRPGFELAALLPPAEALLGRPELKIGLRTLLTGLDRLLKADPTHAAALARLYAGALAHADAGVQERAAKSLAGLLGAKKPLLHDLDAAEATATIATYAELLGPPARATLEPWLVAAPVAAAVVEQYAPVADFRPELSAATAVAPVADWHELLFLTGHVLRHDDPLALERWLDGLLRLYPTLPPDYAAQLLPYLPQMLPYGREPGQPLTLAQVQETQAAGHAVVGHAGLAQALVLGWMLGFPEALVPLVKPGYYAEPEPLVAAEQQRLAFAEALLRTGRTVPLLSTPTHAPHWLAPTALVQRLLAYEAAGQQPDPADLAIALARLAWATEADAATASGQLPELRQPDLRELLTWMLSPKAGPLPATALLATTPSSTSAAQPSPDAAGALAAALPWLWAVAARTRQPAGEFAALGALAPSDCANVVRPCPMGWDIVPQSRTHKVTWKPGVTEETEHWLELRMQPLVPVATPPTPVALYALYPAAPTAFSYRWNALSALGANYPFLATLLPQYPDPLHWRALLLAAMRDSGETGPREVLSQTLRGLLAPGPVFSEPATLLLAVSLTHQQPLVRALALEVLLVAIEHGRLVPGALAHALGRLLSASFVPLARLTAGLAQARAISPRTDDALRQLLEALLPALPAAPLRQAGALMTLYADLPGRASHPVPAPVQARLREWSTSAALKKLAAPLLA